MTHVSRTVAGLALLVAPLSAALAQPAPAPAVSVDSTLFVERTKIRDGAAVRLLEPAARLTRGDRVVTVVNWYRLGGNGGFVVTNALPGGLAYQQSAEPSEEVSVDGGRNWGQLGNLRIGNRMATPEDVTHVRWRVSPAQAMAGAGRIAYAGFVR